MLRTLSYALILSAAIHTAAYAQDATITDITTTTAPDTGAVTTPVDDTTTSGTAPMPSDEDASTSAPISPEVQAIMNTPDAPDITPPGAPPAPVTETAEPKAPEYEDTPQVELRILDKVRAESRTYVLNVGRTVAYANIRIRPRACRKSSPLDDPENAAFLQIWEVKPDQTSAWIFSGWMFASSPSLSGMDHPVYDVTVLDCKTPDSGIKSDSTATTTEEAPAETPAATPSDTATKGAVEPDASAAPSKP